MGSHRARDVVHKRIRELWKSGRVVPTHHADERFEESGLSYADVWNVLKQGAVFKIDVPFRLTRYHFRGRSLHGQSVVCPVEIDGDELIIVTVFLEE